MERLFEALNKLDNSRFLILYGLGSSDSFIDKGLLEQDLAHALLIGLKEQGFSRVVYVSPTRPIFFLDDQSQELSQSFLWGMNHDDGYISSNQTLQPGPFGNRQFFPISSTSVNYSFNSIGDTHLIRLLDLWLREDTKTKTAIIILQAETFINNINDIRTLSGLLDDWAVLPSTNPNKVIFAFNANNYDELATIAGSMPVPEIRSIILRKTKSANKNISTHIIDGPQDKEAARIIEYARQNYGTEFDEDLIGDLVKQICSDTHQLKTWLNRFSNCSIVDREYAYKSGWFQHFRGDAMPAYERLMELTGLEDIKQRITELAGWAANRRSNQKPSKSSPLLHLIFLGNAGTGKTTVARLTGELFYDLNIVKKGHLVETKAADLIADHVGGTAIKTNQIIDQALGGILFIDEAYSLSSPDRGGYGAEAIETLLTRMEDDRDNLIIILAGYPDKIRSFLQSNPGLSRRFPVENRFQFKDFSPDELMEIFIHLLNSRNLIIDRKITNNIRTIIQRMSENKNPNFGNAGDIRNFVDSLERKCLSRYYLSGNQSKPRISIEDISQEYLSFLQKDDIDPNLVLSELDNLIGLSEIKKFIHIKLNRLQFDQMRGINQNHNNPVLAQHLIFTGNPGTGKTTVARLLGKMYLALGILRKGHTVEVAMPDLIAGYVGQTAGKVTEHIEKALDGVLFIDEAYALVRGNSMFSGSFGHEVIDTLVKAMEDYRGRLVIIMAGYTQEMDILLHSNPGLKSRFAAPLSFPDVTREDMQILLDRFLDKDRFTMGDESRIDFINQLEGKKNADPIAFGNIRDIISSYERMKDRVAERIMNEQQYKSSRDAIDPDGWIEIKHDDVIETAYTVVIEGRENQATQESHNLKSWVIPKK